MMKLDNLTVGYGRRILIERATLTLDKGRLVALIGRNGAGKSSLLRVLSGIDRPMEGSVEIEGRDIDGIKPHRLARLISLVTTERIHIANLRCLDLVAMGRAPYTDWIGRLSDEDRHIAAEALATVGMAEYAGRTLDKMSDGECQRVMIARALAQQTPVVLLDEPTSFLDLPNRYETCLLLKNLAHESGRTIIFSTHELDIALSIADDIMLIDSPSLVFGPVEEVVRTGAIERLFRSTNVSFDPDTLKIVLNKQT